MRTDSMWVDRGVLVLRAALGVVFVMHGWQKLFVFGPEGVAGMFASLGIPWPQLTALAVATVELGGGLAILAGAATRILAAILAVVMAVAALTVHLPHGFFLPQGYEFTLALGLSAIALVMTGAGRYSIDAAIRDRRAAATDGGEADLKVAA